MSSFLRLVRESVGQAAASLRVNALRTGLGALAIAVAVATIVFVVTALDGVARYARTTTARSFGAETFLIAQVASPGRVSRKELQVQLQRNPAIRRAELRAIDGLAGGVVQYAPNAQTIAEVTSGGRDVRERRRHRDHRATGRYPRSRHRARPLLAARTRTVAGAQVAVIGADDRRPLFPGGAIRSASQSGCRAAGSKSSACRTGWGISGGASLDQLRLDCRSSPTSAHSARPRTLQIFAKTVTGAARGDRGRTAPASRCAPPRRCSPARPTPSTC